MKPTPAKTNRRSVTDIDLPTVSTKKSSKPEVPKKALEGDRVERYTEALRQIEAAEAVINELKPDLLDEGIRHVFGHNCENAGDTKALISSVKLFDEDQDLEEEGAKALMISVQKKVGKLDAEAVNAGLLAMRRKDGKRVVVDDYVGYEVKATFDTSIFNDESGKFSKDRYVKVMEALAAVSEELGVDNPLSCGKVMSPQGDWHERRWVDFDLEANLAIQADLIPSVVAVKAVAPVNGK